MDPIEILKHNVTRWKPYRFHLINSYKQIDPYIMLLSSHGLTEEEALKMHEYTTHKVNTSNELQDGSVILVKTHINHKIEDNFFTDIIQITSETRKKNNIHCYYLSSPKKTLLTYTRLHELTSHTSPTYIIADSNAKHHILGNCLTTQ